MVSADVVVVGGGITGCYAAWWLTSQGLKVAILEPGDICGQTSAWNPGGLNPLHGVGIPGDMAGFAMQSFELHRQAMMTLGESRELSNLVRKAARLHLAFEEGERDALADTAARYEQTPGFAAEILDVERMCAMVPALKPSLAGGVLLEGNFSLNTSGWGGALVSAVLSAGGNLIRRTAIGVRQGAGKINAVCTPEGDIACGAVVFATGVWTREVEKILGTVIPVEPVKGDLLVAGMIPGLNEIDISYGLAGIYHSPNGRLYLGGTEERRGLDAEPGPEAASTILDGLARFIRKPDFDLQAHGAGLRPVSRDGRPLIGRAPGWENAYVALAGGRKGILYSAGMGQAISDLITRRRTELAIDACAPERFTRT